MEDVPLSSYSFDEKSICVSKWRGVDGVCQVGRVFLFKRNVGGEKACTICWISYHKNVSDSSNHTAALACVPRCLNYLFRIVMMDCDLWSWLIGSRRGLCFLFGSICEIWLLFEVWCVFTYHSFLVLLIHILSLTKHLSLVYYLESGTHLLLTIIFFEKESVESPYLFIYA